MEKELKIKSKPDVSAPKKRTYVGPDYQNNVWLPTMPHPIQPRELDTSVIEQFIRDYPEIERYFQIL